MSLHMMSIARKSWHPSAAKLVSSCSVHTVVFIRHGESIWNVDKKFTGWCDVPLSELGVGDARDAGKLMGERGLYFDIAFTSNLERAWRTCAIALSEANQSHVRTIRSWKLNERHYGGLQGFSKDSDDLKRLFGEEKIVEWRRSYRTAPPSLDDPKFVSLVGKAAVERNIKSVDPNYWDHTMMDFGQHAVSRHLKHGQDAITSPTLSSLPDTVLPKAESLKECEERAFGYWNEEIAPLVRAGKRVLVVAHANTIRALVKEIDHIDEDNIPHLKIPNGIPLIYTLDKNLQPTDMTDDLGFQAKYLVSPRNHSRMMAYERCVQKKLRSLFEFLDTDRDGVITQDCLLQGIARLQSFKGFDGAIAKAAAAESCRVGESEYCEYSVEEVLRCIRDAPGEKGMTLQEFLESEKDLSPHLSRLRLLQ